MSVEQLKEMAKIHLQTVAQTINDLKAQRNNIDNEINKLVNYYEEKVNLIKDDDVE